MESNYLDQVRIAIDSYKERFTNESLRHILLNYSDTEIGQRHPELPIGSMLRDQGQFDLYAGPTRLIGNMDGGLYTISSTLSLNANSINVNCATPQSFVLNGKRFTEKVHNGSLFISAKSLQNLEGIGFIKVPGNNQGETKALQSGDLINTLPASEVFELLGVFEEVDIQDTPEYDSYLVFEELIS